MPKTVPDAVRFESQSIIAPDAVRIKARDNISVTGRPEARFRET